MEKIIQIIPAPGTMRAYYENGASVAAYYPVAYLALVGTPRGKREVRAMIADQHGCFDFAEDGDSFLGITAD